MYGNSIDLVLHTNKYHLQIKTITYSLLATTVHYTINSIEPCSKRTLFSPSKVDCDRLVFSNRLRITPPPCDYAVNHHSLPCKSCTAGSPSGPPGSPGPDEWRPGSDLPSPPTRSEDLSQHTNGANISLRCFWLPVGKMYSFFVRLVVWAPVTFWWQEPS